MRELREPRELRVAGGVAAALALALALGACDSDTLRIAFQISGGPVQACPSSAMPAAPTCGDVPMLCDAVLNIRIVRPSSPEETYLPLCEAIPRDGKRDLCALELINLPARQLPKETLEVQVMVWPRDEVKVDPATGELDCREVYGQPVSTGFGVHGFPEEIAPSPALGGRAYFRPGDDLTVVTLGCSDLASVNRPACTGPIDLRASVTQFGNWGVRISPPAALVVSIGEPRYDADRKEHAWTPIKQLDPSRTEPSWSAALDRLDVEESLCVEVLGNVGANTAAIRCERIDPIDPMARTLELGGVWLPTSRLAQILAGLSFTEVPGEGLTIGVLLDEQGTPASGYQIRTSPDTPVLYLDASSQVVPGGTTTTETGLFVSTGAPYGSDFRAFRGDQLPRAVAIGGRVSGKVTVVVLRLGSVASG